LVKARLRLGSALFGKNQLSTFGPPNVENSSEMRPCLSGLRISGLGVTSQVGQVVFPYMAKSEKFSESSLVGITDGRVAVRLDPFGVLYP